MTKSNSSATLSTSNLYEHPWYSQLQLLDSTTTCESQSQQKPKLEITGATYTKCIHCGGPPANPFFNNSTQKWLQKSSCKSCDNFWTRHKFRMTPADRDMLNANPFCQICGTTENLHIDHCHDTNKIRGYLCANHNKAIGLFDENIEDLQSAIDYLNLHGHQI